MRYRLLVQRLICGAALGLVCFLSNATEITNKRLTYDVSGSDAWAPYFMVTEQGREYGIMPELVSRIFAKAALAAEAKSYPPKRTNSYILDGTLDVDVINPDWIPNENLRKQFVYSDKLIEIKEFYITRKGFKVGTFFSVKDTVKPQVGMIRGYYYHNQTDYTRVNFPSEKSLIEALNKKRIDVIICGDLPAMFWAKPQGIKLDLVKLHSKGFLKLRMRKELAPLIPKLNQAIRELHEDGTIATIVKKYR